MTQDNVRQLSLLVREKKPELLDRWRAQVRTLPGAQGLDRPTLDDHVPDLISELAEALDSRCDETITEAHISDGARAHGVQRLRAGFDLSEVVAEYNVLRGCLHDLALANGLALLGTAFHIANRVLDEGIAGAVRSYAEEREREVQERREEHLAFVAHDLRTPLHAISLCASLIEDELRGSGATEPASAALETMRRNLQRLNVLVGEVVASQRKLSEDGRPEIFCRDIDLWPLVERLIRDLRPLHEANATRVLNRVPRELVVRADAELLVRVIQNLIANAIEYAPGGRVTIDAERREDGLVVGRVADDGRGIPPDLLPRVFDKLEADPEKGDGHGLGLAIVRDSIERHGGRVTVESRLGEGTTFRFELPS